MATFGQSERNIVKALKEAKIFTFENTLYEIKTIGKPTCRSGEPKTDIYIFALSQNNIGKEFKISFKQENADFIENKTNAERAEALFGEHWDTVISSATKSIMDKFLNKPLIYKIKSGKTDEGAITVGWKYELLNKTGGELSGVVQLTFEQIMDVYAGTHLADEKRNAFVNGISIAGSGIANFILMNDNANSAQEIIDNIIPMDEYVKKYPVVYFACKALNYRTYKDKFDGNRPLSVYVDWSIENGKLNPILEFDNPLGVGGNEVVAKLKRSMAALGMVTTEDINRTLVTKPEVIKE